jgi:regulator of sirC expression with transglutaminase-like and TPR domain
MSSPLSLSAPSTLDYFGALVADDMSFPLLEAAISIAQDEDPGLDVQGALARVDELAERLRRRLPPDAPPLQRLRSLTQYFFQELGFSGNVNDYYDRRNSLLPAVLESRRGIPISLAVLFIEIARQLDLDALGVSFPGHFLIKVPLPKGDVVLDPFTGHSLDRDDLEERLLPYRQRALPQSDWPLSLFLQASPPRDILARMLRNLKEIHRSHCDWRRLEQTLARMVVLLPQAWEEHRDHALALAELGQHRRAAAVLETYLQQRPDAIDAQTLRRHQTAWLNLQ